MITKEPKMGYKRGQSQERRVGGRGCWRDESKEQV